MIDALPTCYLYTQDEDLERRILAYTRLIARVRTVDSSSKLTRVLKQSGSTLVLADLRAEGCTDMLPHIRKQWADTLVIGLGVPKSDPMMAAEAMGVYAVEALDCERQRIQGLVSRALDHLQLSREARTLREQVVRLSSVAQTNVPARQDRGLPTRTLQHFARAVQSFDDVDSLLDQMAEAVATSTMVTRAGIFTRLDGDESYALRAGYKCCEDAGQRKFTDDDFIVQWLLQHSHVIARSTLQHVEGASERETLRDALDDLGVEIILPLQARGELLGWLMVGHRVTGVPFESEDLEDMMMLADHLSSTLDNALLHRQTKLQKTLADQLLQSMPTGIIAVSEEGAIRWFNNSAEQILSVQASTAIDEPADMLGSRVSGFIRQTLDGDEVRDPAEWFDQVLQKHLRLYTRRLEMQGECIGALVLVQDMTGEKILREKQDSLERAAFWAELAASMSHEVRNPLVAIKTFAQLLPERYEDEEFRDEFSTLVDQEVGRLNKMIDQINHYAHPPELEFLPLNLGVTVSKAINMALVNYPKQAVNVEVAIPDNLPAIRGDDNTLTECFVHLIGNALEAIAKQKSGRVTVSAKTVNDGNENTHVQVRIEDTGQGISQQMLEKVYSPFSTTKARGMGLGMPIAKRTLVDHRGELRIETGSSGTCVTVSLPIEQKEEYHEAHTHS